MRYFNTEGICSPKEHYMVPLANRLEKIKRLYVDRKKYFVMNRGRQYGKTTTLKALAEYLKDEYLVIFMDFQLMSTANFASEQTFVARFASYLLELLAGMERERDMEKPSSMDVLFDGISRFCGRSEKPVVLIIDEVDSAANHQVFLDFLAMLRGYYLNREAKATFHSVILAGVYDVKNLKLKFRSEEEHQYNSPWNIAAKFDLDMCFSADQIGEMLSEYEADHHTGMNVKETAREIYQYTSGYPYLVSAVCKILDEELAEKKWSGDFGRQWAREGIAEAVRILLSEKIPLFESMVKQMDRYPELKDMTAQILYEGKGVPFHFGVKPVSLGVMFGFLKEKDGYVAVANRIFEIHLLNMFTVEEAIRSDVFQKGKSDKNQFIRDGRLDMEHVLEKFAEYFHEVYGDNDEKFIEKYGRKFFLLYLKPIINGTGNYYMEAQTRDGGRTDVVVDYLGERFIVEMKIWHGNEYNERGERQLAEYLDYFKQKKGYMLSFNFNKNKEVGVKTMSLGDKMIVEAVV